ncbi:hypothetical protein [Bacillus massiliglaciei]|uniref:hypothetical protein n=1 Tax=Bacillus massiliglaciei TaxID=1816693 RepID=UPI0018FE5B3F|nr:hypothetical protein [Bacillus massiliglaciei]
MEYYYNTEVKYLLINESDEKVEVQYADNAQPFKLPLIGPRPPYYCHPRYVQEFPII